MSICYPLMDNIPGKGCFGETSTKHLHSNIIRMTDEEQLEWRSHCLEKWWREIVADGVDPYCPATAPIMQYMQPNDKVIYEWCPRCVGGRPDGCKCPLCEVLRTGVWPEVVLYNGVSHEMSVRSVDNCILCKYFAEAFHFFVDFHCACDDCEQMYNNSYKFCEEGEEVDENN